MCWERVYLRWPKPHGPPQNMSQFGLLLDEAYCLQQVDKLVTHADELGVFVRLDMEDSACTEATLQIYKQLRKTHRNCGLVLQARLKRSLQDATHLIEIGYGEFRLCKGIYLEPDHIAYTGFLQIQQNYLSILKKMLSETTVVGIASHDPVLIESAKELISRYRPQKEGVEFQMLYGVNMALAHELLQAGYPVRIYIPYGPDWLAYSLRRFQENPDLLHTVITATVRQFFRLK
jgi:proline dehydrogenase